MGSGKVRASRRRRYDRWRPAAAAAATLVVLVAAALLFNGWALAVTSGPGTGDRPVDPASLASGPPSTTVPRPPDADPGTYRGDFTGPLFVGRDIVSFETNGNLSNIRPDDSLVWTQSCSPGGYLETIPRDHEGMVLLNCNQVMRAVDGATGAKRWEKDISSARADWTRASSTTVARVVGERLEITDARTGADRWSRALTADGHIHPLDVDDRVVYVGDHGSLLALDATTGEVRWTADLGIAWVTSAAEGVFVRADDHTLASLDPATGGVRWRSPRDDRGLWNATVVGITGDRVIVQRDWWRGMLGYDRATGQPVWSIAAPNDEQRAAAVGAGRIAFSTKSGLVRIVDAETGEELAAKPAIAARPSIDPSTRRIAYIDGQMHLVVEPLP